MADAPEVAEAKAKLRGLVVPAVETLADLVDSEHAGIRLGAAKEILDRGGVPARHDHNVQVEIGIDEEIEELIAGVRRQIDGKSVADELKADLIEDAEVIEDERELTVGEQAAANIGVQPDDTVAEAETLEYEAPAAWWQVNPNQ